MITNDQPAAEPPANDAVDKNLRLLRIDASEQSEIAEAVCAETLKPVFREPQHDGSRRRRIRQRGSGVRPIGCVVNDGAFAAAQIGDARRDIQPAPVIGTVVGDERTAVCAVKMDAVAAGCQTNRERLRVVVKERVEEEIGCVAAGDIA